jgi:two-component system, OmpR family, response regulator
VSALHIEIVEGNPHLRSLLGWHLQQAGYSIYLASNAQQAQEVFQIRHPDLVILDADLPGTNGLDLCRWLQRQHQCVIFILSARNGEADIVSGLKAGADDYLTKPFGMQEFLARVESLARRCRPTPPAYLNYGDLRIDLIQRRVHLHQELVDLTPQEFSLLYVLAQAGGTALSRQELLQRAWPDNIDNPRTVDTHILSLRKKIELSPQQPCLIQTVRNVGYRLNLENLTVAHSSNANGNGHSNHSAPALSKMPGRDSLRLKFSSQ